MYKFHLLIIVSSPILVGCMTVQMPELSQSHPAHPEAEAASVSAWPSILQLREEPLIAPPLPLTSDSRTPAPSLEVRHDHSITVIGVGSEMYVCPMHAEITSKSPASCSECGMDLVKKGGA